MFKKLILGIIRFYQRFLSPDQGIFNSSGLKKNCRFYPSCSEYTYQAIEKYGTLAGFRKGIKRMLKCYPWHPGGIDLP